MRAVRINNASDDLSGVELVELEQPAAGPGQLRVRLSKAAVHPSDINYIRGDYRKGLERLIWNRGAAQPTFDTERTKPHPELPCIPGGEGVGVVDQCGDGVDAEQWQGKRVALFAGPPNGVWQEYIVVAPQQLSLLPEPLSDDQAALMMLNPLTALVMVKSILNAQPGQWLLISAGASGVSKHAAALGRHFGFKTISVVRNRMAPADTAELGDVVVNLAEQDLRDEVARATDGRGVELAIDCVGGATGEAMIGSLTDGGRMLLYGTLAGPSMELHSRDLMMTNAFVGGFYLPGWMAAQSPQTLGEVMQELSQLIAAGVFGSAVEAIYPLSDALAAVRAALEPGRRGKILLDLTR